MTGVDIVQSLLALAVCGGAFSALVSGWAAEERRVAMYCWLAHMAGAFAIIAVYTFYYGWGDMLHYFAHGRFLAAYVEYDPVRHFPDLLDLLFQRDTDFSLGIDGAGTSTGTMVAVGGLVGLLTRSSWAGSALISTVAASGQACLWLGIRSLVPKERATTALWTTFLVPSVVFWSSSLLKEAFALVGIGLVVFGAARLRARALPSAALLLGAGVYTIGLFKPYVLFPLSMSVGVYAYWDRAAARGGVQFRPITLVGGAGVTLAALLVLGQLFPRYSVDTVADSIEQQQTASMSTRGGSDFRTAPSEERQGAAGLLVEAPYTIMTALIRPVIFESRSAMMLVNSLETSVVLYFIIMAFTRTGRLELARWVWRSPDILACVVFVLLFSLAVGLATTNLGTLSRYRLPMMPFYFYIVFSAYRLPAVVRARRRRASTVTGAMPATDGS
ncbi:MAG: hypothetical protein H6725_03405 [Sandaracinaceae bacterium]|nr:hypothetical protein [Sandaracinaceae bacterium]